MKRFSAETAINCKGVIGLNECVSVLDYSVLGCDHAILMILNSKSSAPCVSFADDLTPKHAKDERTNSRLTDAPSNTCSYSEIISKMPLDHNAVLLQYQNTDIVYHFRPFKRPSKLDQLQENWRKMGSDALATVLSALYGKLLVVMGMAFPMSEVISTHIPHSYYEVYYLYLYIGSMLFLCYMYTMLCKLKKKSNSTDKSSSSSSDIENSSSTSHSSSSGNSDYTLKNSVKFSIKTSASERNTNKLKSKYFTQSRQVTQHFGSFYLRMGAVAFGIGSMIYSGLEIGQYFELERNTKCHNVLVAVTPATRMAFIFIQMYFIFLNEEIYGKVRIFTDFWEAAREKYEFYTTNFSTYEFLRIFLNRENGFLKTSSGSAQQIKVTRHRVFSRFGLMHMIGTNLSVWLNVLIQETKHEILTFYNPENNTIEFNKQNAHYQHTFARTPPPIFLGAPSNHSTTEGGMRHKRSLGGTHYIYDCRRTNIIGSLVQNASPFLFPCTIEYSLICAAILYVMWRNCNVDLTNTSMESTSKVPSIPQLKKAPHHYSVDCAQAHKGLFLGILFLVLTIISLILFFVLVSKPELVRFAVMEVNICELSLYVLSTFGSLVGMIEVRQLKFNGSRNLELDNILLVGAQTGILIYSTFTIIGCHFTEEKNTLLVLLTASASLIQTFFQTLFILDASRRSCITQEQIRRKPGRETITFLLVNNLAMWAINTLEKSRADSHPIQLHFYGLWAWTIITHVSMPLAIFYRFHSTVCLCEIWKRAYKIKHSYL